MISRIALTDALVLWVGCMHKLHGLMVDEETSAGYMNTSMSILFANDVSTHEKKDCSVSSSIISRFSNISSFRSWHQASGAHF